MVRKTYFCTWNNPEGAILKSMSSVPSNHDIYIHIQERRTYNLREYDVD